jgi:hypothetical protein
MEIRTVFTGPFRLTSAQLTLQKVFLLVAFAADAPALGDHHWTRRPTNPHDFSPDVTYTRLLPKDGR